MKLYIDGPADGGEGVYHIVCETGEALASHYCTHVGFARGDLEANRPERQNEWRARFGEYEVVVLGCGSDDGMTHEELVRRNHAIAAAWEASGGTRDE